MLHQRIFKAMFGKHFKISYHVYYKKTALKMLHQRIFKAMFGRLTEKTR